MSALLSLEWQFLRNNFLEILRSPSRLALWLGYALVLLTAGAFRLHATLGAEAPSGLLSPALACAVGGAVLAMLGGSIVNYALGHVGAFRSRSEALLFANAGLSSQTITAWLQVRKLFASLSRWIWTIVLNFVIFLPAHARPNELARGFLASVIAAMLVMALEIPVFLLGRMKFGVLLVVAGAVAAFVGLGYLLLGLGAALGSQFINALLVLLPYTPASTVFALVRGSELDLAIFATLPFLISLSIFGLGRDAVPELSAASVRWFTSVERRHGTSFTDYSGLQENRKFGWIPPGPFVLLWKDWMAFRRRRGATLAWLVVLSISLALGSTMAALTAQTHRESDGWALLSVMSAFVYFVPLFASIELADDVGKPLFWMTSSSLVAALAAWTLARSWRGAIVVAAAPLVAGLGMGDHQAAAISVPITVTLWFSLNAIGVFVYSLFPSRFDARGPLFFVRLFVAFALLIPGLLVFASSVIATHSLFLAMLSGCLTYAIEAALCLFFSAALLSQNGAGTAMLERAS
ncbi:MAG TPA: putative ABC exporter domain-containing protein [Candidatus Baltobacteraceae bacterium]